jgi:hypothetical protein
MSAACLFVQPRLAEATPVLPIRPGCSVCPAFSVLPRGPERSEGHVGQQRVVGQFALGGPVRRTGLTTIYGLGLRLGDGLHREVGQIESSRQLVMVRSGNGAKDRAVPLPTLQMRDL